MESLVLLVIILLLIVLLSGPLVLLLTCRKARSITYNNPIAKWSRRGFAILIGAVGCFISLQLLRSDVTTPIKILAIATLSQNFYAFRAEWRARHLS